MGKVKDFLQRKDIVFSVDRYLIKALSAMAVSYTHLVGILSNVEQETVHEQIFPGDMIILASDGLLDMDSQDEGQWLSRVISQAVVNNPQSMAEYLLDKVISISGGKIKDDITVMVAQMGEIA